MGIAFAVSKRRWGGKLINARTPSLLFHHSCGEGEFDGNNLFGNTSGAVLTSAQGNPKVCHNYIHHNAGAGVLAESLGQGLFEGNVISQNLGPGIRVEVGSEQLSCVREGGGGGGSLNSGRVDGSWE